jgi:hypothetical protein
VSHNDVQKSTAERFDHAFSRFLMFPTIWQRRCSWAVYVATGGPGDEGRTEAVAVAREHDAMLGGAGEHEG